MLELAEKVQLKRKQTGYDMYGAAENMDQLKTEYKKLSKELGQGGEK